MKINVTAEDIKNGEIKSCDKCPVGLALQRMFPDQEITVFYRSICVGSKTYYPINDLPVQYLTAIDAGNKVLPTVLEYKEYPSTIENR